ncbi:MAG: aminoacyl-tRNA hydrolase [Coprobacillaceae bacterium]
MKLVVGLGTPGKEYENTRHNCGFMVIDEIAKQLAVEVNQNKCKGLYVKTKYKGEDIILLKPQTFMNLSGESVRQCMDFFKIDKEDVIVIYDDLDMPTGKLRLRNSGGAGGHNGIKSLIQHLGGQDFKRIRVGIDRHPYIKVVDYVLGKFSKEEQDAITKGISLASDAVLTYIEKDFTTAMNQYN